MACERIEMENQWLMERLSAFLGNHADAITGDMVRELSDGAGVDGDEAYALLLAAMLGLDTAANPANYAMYRRYFPKMLKRLDAGEYRADPYYRAVKLPQIKLGAWELRQERYRPYEAFVRDDLTSLPDGRVLPQIGYFAEEFSFPALLENGREWMLITPNEINTMRPAIQAARGRALSYGLGLGYFAFMAARKPEVQSVTVVERDARVISLFEKYVLPTMADLDKLVIVKGDAFEYAERCMGTGRFDTVFTDLWHDPSDGVALYRRMRACERFSPQSEYSYWIEPTLKRYL